MVKETNKDTILRSQDWSDNGIHNDTKFKLENSLKKNKARCQEYSKYHKTRSETLLKTDKMYSYFCTISTGITALSGIFNNYYDSSIQNQVVIVNTCLLMVSAIVNIAKSVYNFSEKGHNHKLVSDKFDSLEYNISLLLDSQHNTDYKPFVACSTKEINDLLKYNPIKEPKVPLKARFLSVFRPKVEHKNLKVDFELGDPEDSIEMYGLDLDNDFNSKSFIYNMNRFRRNNKIE